MFIKKKSQSAIEFMILIGAVLFLFLIFLHALQVQQTDQKKEKRDEKVKEIALALQDEINLAFSSTDGYQRSFTLPSKVDILDYNVSLQNDFVYIITQNGKHAIALPTVNVTGQPKKGPNMIKKINNTLFLNT